MNKVWHALADETRRSILRLLRDGDMTASTIAGKFDLTQATISHHLSILREAKLVTSNKSAQTITYSLNMTIWQEICGYFAQFLDKNKNENKENNND